MVEVSKDIDFIKDFLHYGLESGFVQDEIQIVYDVYKANIDHSASDKYIHDVWDIMKLMKQEKYWDYDLRENVKNLLFDKVYGASVRKIFKTHPESEFIDQALREGRRTTIQNMVARNRAKHERTVVRPKHRIKFADKQQQSSEITIYHDVIETYEGLDAVITASEGSGVWVRWKYNMSNSYEITIPSQFDSLRCFSLINAGNCYVTIKSGSYVNFMYVVSGTLVNFSESMLPHHEGFLPIVIDIEKANDTSFIRMKEDVESIIITGICHKGELRRQHIDSLAEMNTNLTDFGFSPDFE